MNEKLEALFYYSPLILLLAAIVWILLFTGLMLTIFFEITQEPNQLCINNCRQSCIESYSINETFTNTETQTLETKTVSNWGN